MAVNETLHVETIDGEQVLASEYVVSKAGDEPVKFSTKNKFVDKDIHLNVSVPEAGAVTLDADDISTEIDMGTPVKGYYEPTATIEGNVHVATAGWMTAGDKAVSEENVKLGKVAQSVSTLYNGNGNQEGAFVDGSVNIRPEVDADKRLVISAGYGPDRTVVIKSMSDGQEAEVSAVDTTVTTLTYTADDTNHTFDISGTQAIPAPTVDQAGIISATKGTKNAATASVDATVDQVKVGVTASSTNVEVTPVIQRTAKAANETFVDVASGAATTSAPTTGGYIKVDVPAVSESVTVSGKVSAAGYGTADHHQKDADTTITAGSKAATTAYIPVASGVVESGTATITSVTHTYDSNTGKFDLSGTASVSAPVVTTAGYTGDGLGTLSAKADGATLDAEVDKIAIGATITGDTAFKPVVAKNAATNVEAGAVTTTQPASGNYYVAVDTAALTGTINATAEVTSAGYGTTTAGQYTTASDSEGVTVSAADVAYIPIAKGSLSNAPESGVSYVDLSADGPIVPSEGYLHIKEGYYPNSKIALARMVPDDATITYASGAGYMLSGQSAYDSDGKLVVGTIPTYDGSYTVG